MHKTFIKPVLYCLTLCLLLLPNASNAKTVTLNKENFVYFGGQINNNSVLKVGMEVDKKINLRKRKQQDYPIYIIIDSFGGDVRSALAFAIAARSVPEMHFIALKAGSAAFMLWQMSPGSRLTIKEPSLMIHPGVSTIFYINEEQFQESSERSIRIHKAFQYNSRAKTLISEEQYISWISKGEKYFTPEEIEAYVIADEVIELKCVKKLKTCPIKRSSK